MKALQIICLVLFVSISASFAQNDFHKDALNTTAGPLEITFIGHGTLMFQFGKLVFHIDPVSQYADYSKLPKADIVLITHHHGDHFDKSALEKITTEDTKVVITEKIAEDYEGGIVMKNWQVKNPRSVKLIL